MRAPIASSGTASARRASRAASPGEEAAVALNLPHVKKDTQGEPIVVFESFVPSEGNRRVTGNRIFLAARRYHGECHRVPAGDAIYRRAHVPTRSA